MKIVKIASAALCCAMAITTFASCTDNKVPGDDLSQSSSQDTSQSASQSTSTPEAKPARDPGFYPDGKKQELSVVATINGTDITFDTFRYYYLSIVNSMITQGQLDEELAKNTAIDYIKDGLAVRAIAADKGVTLTPEFETELDELLETQKASFPTEDEYNAALKGMFMTSEVFREMGIDNLIFGKYLAAAYMEDVKNNVAENFVHVKHILVQFPQEATDEQKQESKNKADDITKKLNEGAVFEDLVKEHSEDPGQPEAGYYFTKGKMVKEFEDKAFEMEIGQTSEPVLTSYGYHILKKYEFEADEMEKNIVAYIPADKVEEIQAALKAKSEGFEIKKCDEWDKITSETIS